MEVPRRSLGAAEHELPARSCLSERFAATTVAVAAELAAYPASAEGGGYELYLMCDDIEATIRELKAKGVEFSSDVTRQRWGLITAIELPGGGRLGLYEPLHASPLLPGR